MARQHRDQSERRITLHQHQLWHLFDAGGPMRHLKVRFRDDREVPDGRNSPDFPDALDEATPEGWREFDRDQDGRQRSPGCVPAQPRRLPRM